MSRLVTFSGIDCSGKSTQIELLRAHLEASGHRVAVEWFRPGYSRWLDVGRATVRRFRPSALPSAGASSERDRAFSRPSVRIAWSGLAVTDSLAHFLGRLRALRLAGKTVICDRYVWDARIDLALRFPELAGALGPTMRGVEVLAPKPDLSILLRIPHEVMLNRMQVKAEPFPDRPEVRDARFRMYDELRKPGVTVVDAVASPQDVHRRICELL